MSAGRRWRAGGALLCTFLLQIQGLIQRRLPLRRSALWATEEAAASSSVAKPWPTLASEVVNYSTVKSVRLRHILCASDGLAEELVAKCRQSADGRDALGELAASLSLCETSKTHGGELGWVAPDDDFLDDAFPRALRKQALTKKPGDLYLERSALGVHVVHVDDVFQTLSPTLRRRAPKIHNDREGYAQARTPLGEILQSTETLTYSIETMGCQMNAADSERMAGQLEEMGLQPHPQDAPKDRSPSVVVINTCSIRDHAEQKVYSYLGPHAVRKRRGDPVSIVVAGCVAQQEGETLVRRVPEIDAVIGPQYANRLSEVLLQVADGDQVVATDATLISEDVTRPRRQSEVCGWVNVIYGCNERCTYCVVPTTRGVEQSRPLRSILTEVEDLVGQGYREITLLGQNIDAWGRDMAPKRRFHELLEAVAKVPGVGRVRFLTSHPRYMSERVVSTVAEHPDVLAPCFHIPFQSGDDKVLREMQRGYTFDSFVKIVRRIRRLLPHAAVTADAIVGFPGETEEEFQRTLDLMEEVKFELCNTAAYSPRPNTPAAERSDQVDEETKARRLQAINELATRHALERSEAYLGRTEVVLVEGPNPRRPGQVYGRTGSNRLVFFDGVTEVLKGKFVRVHIDEARTYSLTGSRIGSDAW